jgi:glutaredoxin 3
MITIYTTKYCPFCRRAVDTLVQLGVSFHLIDVSDNPEARAALTERTGSKTVPQIFVKDQFIGGCSDLDVILERGKFMELLKD